MHKRPISSTAKLSIITLFVMVIMSACNSKSDNPKSSTKEPTKNVLELKNDWICVPGKRIGPIEGSFSLTDIQKAFPKDQIIKDSLGVGEGFYLPVTKVYPNTENELSILWDEASFGKQIKRIFIKNENSNWKLDSGIKIGSPYTDLVKANEVDFNFYGFDWDYGGSVMNWEGGKYEDSGLGVRFAYLADLNVLTKDEISKVIGDQEVSSAEEALKKMDVRIKEFFFFFNTPQN